MREMRGQTAVRGVRHVLKSVDGGPTTVDVGDGRTTPVVSSVVINDYAGHPFQIDLSRELASRQVRVDHAYCDTNVTPRADLSDEVAELQIVGISTGKGFDKYDAKKRLVAEIRYGIASARLLVARRPHVTLNSNVPVISLAIVTAVAKALRIKNVLWLQDFQAGLIAMVLGSKRHPIYRAMAWLENWCIRAADHVVTISDGFEREAVAIGRDPKSVTTIPNWAPIDELPMLARDNDWAKAQGLIGRTVYLYSGTLGMKHRPEALLELSRGGWRVRIQKPSSSLLARVSVRNGSRINALRRSRSRIYAFCRSSPSRNFPRCSLRRMCFFVSWNVMRENFLFPRRSLRTSARVGRSSA